MLNRYIWELYLNSGGTRVVELFRKNLEDELTDDWDLMTRSFSIIGAFTSRHR